MENVENDINNIEISIEQAEKVIKLSEQADKMANTPAFKKVILEGYMRDEASRLAGMLAEPSMADEVNQRELQSALKAIGHLRQYLIGLRRQGIFLREQIEEDKQALQDIRENVEG